MMRQSPSLEANSLLVKKLPCFYGTRMFITVFIREPPAPVLIYINAVHILP
jgi:hypothetical protein